MPKIFNKENIIMLIILVLGFGMAFFGRLSGFQELCDHYGTKPDYKTIFSTLECTEEIKPLTCNLPVPDMSVCNGFNKTT